MCVIVNFPTFHQWISTIVLIQVKGGRDIPPGLLIVEVEWNITPFPARTPNNLLRRGYLCSRARVNHHLYCLTIAVHRVMGIKARVFANDLLYGVMHNGNYKKHANDCWWWRKAFAWLWRVLKEQPKMEAQWSIQKCCFIVSWMQEQSKTYRTTNTKMIAVN